MKSKQESIMSGMAAALVLFTSMLNPMVSVGLAVLMLGAFSIYKYKQFLKK